MTSIYILEYHPVNAWVLSQDDKKFGKMHPTLLICMTQRIQRYITCPDRWSLPGGDRVQSRGWREYRNRLGTGFGFGFGLGFGFVYDQI